MHQRAYFADADHIQPLIGMIEEAQVTQLHGAHVVARLVIADTVPFFTGLPLRFQHFP